MKQNVVKIGIVVGITLLFFGANVTPTLAAQEKYIQMGSVIVETSDVPKSSFEPAILDEKDDVNDVISIKVPLNRLTVEVNDDADPSWYDMTHVHTITEADAITGDGDTIFVWDGTYNEAVIIHHSVTLQGNNQATTIINAAGWAGFNALALDDDQITVKGFTIRNGAFCGIFSQHDAHIIQNNIVENSGECGVHLDTCDDFLITGNTIRNNQRNGIHLINCEGGAIDTNPSINNNGLGGAQWPLLRSGIVLETCSYVTISNNIIINNNHGIGIYITRNSHHITVTSNTIQNNQDDGINCEEDPEDVNPHDDPNWPSDITIQDNTITGSDHEQIHLYSGKNILIQNNDILNGDMTGITVDTQTGVNCCILNNKIQGNGITGGPDSAWFAGILICTPNKVIVQNNNIHNNHREGIHIFSDSNPPIPNNQHEILNNIVKDNELEGILINDSKQSNNNVIRGNDVQNNKAGGIMILNAASTGNQIDHNRVAGNTLGGAPRNAQDNGPAGGNHWDNGYPAAGFNPAIHGGNFWGDYAAPDNFNGPAQNAPGDDGVGNLAGGGLNPYLINGVAGPQDNYPFNMVIEVDDNNPDPNWYDPTHVHTIAEALAIVQDGQTIFVWDGTYPEIVTVTHDITLQGNNPATTIIDGFGLMDSAIVILDADGITVTGFTIQHGEFNGILCDKNAPTITNNIIEMTFGDGISLSTSQDFLISENTVRNHNGNGIILFNCNQGRIISNPSIRDNGYDGIKIIDSNHITLSENTVIENFQIGIHLKNCDHIDITKNPSISDNGRINNGAVLYRSGIVCEICSDIDVSNNKNPGITDNNRIGIYITNESSNIIISNNDITNNGDDGVNCESDPLDINPPDNPNWPSDVTIQENTITGSNDEQIHLYSGKNILIQNNKILNGKMTGITVDTQTGVNCRILNNEISGNGQVGPNWFAGILICTPNKVKVQKNNIHDNHREGIYIFSDSNPPAPNNQHEILNNLVTDNGWQGIAIRDKQSDNNVIRGNDVQGNQRGGIMILDAASTGNQIDHNRVAGNTLGGAPRNAQDDGPAGGNHWDNGYPAAGFNPAVHGGNFWGDYASLDNFNGLAQNIPGPDLVGDLAPPAGGLNPYLINGVAGPQDTYPFVGLPPFALGIKVFLEGPFDAGAMRTTLNTAGVLPLAQPYTGAPWNYAGTENVPNIPNANIVDWVLVELRDAPNAAAATAATTIARQAAFLLNDGTIVGMDGTSPLQFDVQFTQCLFLVVYHRNHLSVMSGNPLLPFTGACSYDFSTSATQAHGNINAQRELAPGVWGMVGGDGNADGQVNNGDKNDVWAPQAGTAGYKTGDFNLDSQVNNLDKNDVWYANVGKGTQVPP